MILRKVNVVAWSTMLVSLILSAGATHGAELTSTNKPAAAKTNAFLGRWDLTVRTADKQLPSWLEMGEEKGALKARFVGRWGNARPLARVQLKDGELLFISPKEEEGSKTDLVFQGTLQGTVLAGSAKGPDGIAWLWTGKRAPALPRPLAVQWGAPLSLFNGKDLKGWRFDNPTKASSWQVQNGTLVNAGAGANIITEQKFQNFKLHIEVNCPAKANSGVYLRGRYEVQIEDDSLSEPPNHHMGAVYGYLAPDPEQPRQPGTWQTFDITLLGRYVTVVQNGQTIIDDKEIPGITGGALDSHEVSPGPIYLQGDHGGIAYRNILLTPATP